MKAIAERSLNKGENSGDLGLRPFFRHFQILRAHCDLIHLPRHGHDGWSDKDFFQISHEGTPRWEKSRCEKTTKKSASIRHVIYLKLMPDYALCETLYLLILGTKYFVRSGNYWISEMFSLINFEPKFTNNWYDIMYLNDWIRYNILLA